MCSKEVAEGVANRAMLPFLGADELLKNLVRFRWHIYNFIFSISRMVERFHVAVLFNFSWEMKRERLTQLKVTLKSPTTSRVAPLSQSAGVQKRFLWLWRMIFHYDMVWSHHKLINSPYTGGIIAHQDSAAARNHLGGRILHVRQTVEGSSRANG